MSQRVAKTPTKSALPKKSKRVKQNPFSKEVTEWLERLEEEGAFEAGEQAYGYYETYEDYARDWDLPLSGKKADIPRDWFENVRGLAGMGPNNEYEDMRPAKVVTRRQPFRTSVPQTAKKATSKARGKGARGRRLTP